MPTLISPTDFIGECNIPNPSNTDVATYIQGFINQYEPNCMSNVLGYVLYKDYLAHMTDIRFVNILNGAEFTDSGNTLRKYVGFKPAILRYIYFYIMSDKSTLTAGFAQVIPKGDVIVPVSPESKMVRAWNFFARNVRELIIFLVANPTTYPEFDSWQTGLTFDFSRPINEFDI